MASWQRYLRKLSCSFSYLFEPVLFLKEAFLFVAYSNTNLLGKNRKTKNEEQKSRTKKLVPMKHPIWLSLFFLFLPWCDYPTVVSFRWLQKQWKVSFLGLHSGYEKIPGTKWHFRNGRLSRRVVCEGHFPQEVAKMQMLHWYSRRESKSSKQNVPCHALILTERLHIKCFSICNIYNTNNFPESAKWWTILSFENYFQRRLLHCFEEKN